jgi:signal transduction histidine kinase
MSEALCVTALGPAALCDAVLDAVGRLFDAEWASLVLTSGDLPSSVPSQVTWYREQGQRLGAPSAEDSAALAARIRDTPQVMAVGDGVARAIVLGAPMRLDRRQVGSLLVGTEHPAGPDGIGMSVLETVANQIVAALRNAWLFEHGEDLRRQAMAGLAEAERHAEELASRNEQLRRARGQLARARQAELVSAERHRIARELHDGVAQCLVGIGMHLEWCHRHLDPASPAYQRLVASKELARAGLGRVRSAVAELSELERPGEGLGEALRDLAGNFRSAGPLRVSVRVGGPQRQLAPEVEHALFQIAQEGLWNVVRHAGAAQAWLNLQYRTGQTRLSISDNGHGDPAAARRHLAGAAPRGRFGLRIMAERAGELGGEVTVQRRRRGGLRIEARIPDKGPGTGAAAGAGPGAGPVAPAPDGPA